jgi:hypothetical protein
VRFRGGRFLRSSLDALQPGSSGARLVMTQAQQLSAPILRNGLPLSGWLAAVPHSAGM